MSFIRRTVSALPDPNCLSGIIPTRRKLLLGAASWCTTLIPGSLFATSRPFPNPTDVVNKSTHGDVNNPFGNHRAIHADDTELTELPATYAELVIVGGGAAGLSAAVTAAETLSGIGNGIVLLEKNSYLGGDTLISGGYFNTVDPARQRPMGVRDSIELFESQILAEGEGANDPDVVHTLATEASEALVWLEAHGMSFLPTVMQVYGSVYPRAHKPILSRGTGYIRTLAEAALRARVNIRTQSRAQSLILNDAGAVIGVLYEEMTDEEPIRRIVWSRRGVILASGGFGANRALLQRYAPEKSTLPIDTQSGSTGDMHLAAEAAGAALTNMNFVECVPGSREGINYPIRLDYIPEHIIFVNGIGERFVDESGTRDRIASAILQTTAPCWTIADQRAVNRFDMLEQKHIHRAFHAGEVLRTNHIEDLPKLLGLPSEAFLSTLRSEPASIRLQQAPFWACRTHLRVHATLGGIRIDAAARVLTPEGKSISGLWAAGACTSNVHGRNRIGGNGINTAVVFGRKAAREAVIRT